MKELVLRVGFLQFTPTFGDPTGSMRTIRDAIQDKHQFDLLVLPELAGSGYNFSSMEEAYACSEIPGESDYIEFIRELAAEKNAAIVTGFNERDGNRLFNTAFLIDPGGIVGKYRKSHLFMNEKDYFQPGDTGFQVFEWKGARIGILICFDYVFPETWRVLGLKKADVVAHPSNLVMQYAQKVVPAQGISNRFYIVTANRTGREKDLEFTGRSFISDPEGDILARAGEKGTEIQISSLHIDRSRNKFITSRNHVFRDRRPEQYKLMDC